MLLDEVCYIFSMSCLCNSPDICHSHLLFQGETPVSIFDVSFYKVYNKKYQGMNVNDIKKLQITQKTLHQTVTDSDHISYPSASKVGAFAL